MRQLYRKLYAPAQRDRRQKDLDELATDIHGAPAGKRLDLERAAAFKAIGKARDGLKRGGWTPGSFTCPACRRGAIQVHEDGVAFGHFDIPLGTLRRTGIRSAAWRGPKLCRFGRIHGVGGQSVVAQVAVARRVVVSMNRAGRDASTGVADAVVRGFWKTERRGFRRWPDADRRVARAAALKVVAARQAAKLARQRRTAGVSP